MGRRTALAVTVHDPGGDFLAGLRRLGERLTSEFVGIGALVTEDTAGSVGVFIANELGARVDNAPSDVSAIGRHRRRAVELALASAPEAVIYSDVAHMLRWIEARPDEVAEAVNLGATTDMLVDRAQ